MLTIDASALSGLAEKVKAYSERVQSEVAFAGAAAMATVIYQGARGNAERNRKSGLLLSAIYRVYAEDDSSATLKTYHVSWNKKRAPHGYQIEFGNSRSPAFPFLRPAMALAGDAIIAGNDRMAERLTETKGRP
ncbi:hypothetical protein O0882_23395 [Janthinobacterium sp. SUN073]|uniref:hypothetical protein n=1 Tax=Janthinobacterium sp. SUN073 TaxID=3004102 RepID=UPI0025AF0B76|nr:hypothetical protein [Janthinobacterium sp. SUN073]MDN2699267.1 hypothetical protein [Janthinobacterium sp. SUN073]